jgi:RHS repeat-associated protein
MGSLLEGQRDAGGLMYMRNRYYDPATGQFTQTDPIGIAGGLNTYGFAAGDPVSYSDPYGLCSTKIDKRTGESVDGGTVCTLDPIVVTGRRKLTREERQQAMEQLVSEETVQRMLGTIGPGGGRATIARGALRRFLGRPFPTKLNRGGRPQPYNPADGHYLPYDANPGFLRGPAGEFSKGLGQGALDAASQGPPGGDPPSSLPNAIGRVIGNVIGKIFGA